MSLDIDEPPNSRLFVVAGRATSAEFLRGVFEQFGVVSFVKYLRDKGVAYVKYDRASSAALAIENLHEVTLNDGRGPRLKVILAESPHMRNMNMGLGPLRGAEDGVLDPDNSPPRSRLFLVVPKSADCGALEADLSRFPDLQYVKTDLVSSKGIAFAKYARSSAAAAAMEAVQASGQVAGYRVKVMLAEPKVRRSPSAGSSGGLFAAAAVAAAGQQGARVAAIQALLGGQGGGAGSAGALAYPGMGQGLFSPAPGLPSYMLPRLGSPIPGQLSGGLGGGGGTAAGTYDPAALDALDFGAYGPGAGVPGLGALSLGMAGMGGGVNGGGFLSPMTPAMSSSSSASQLSRQRLFVVLHKSVGDETLACLFRSFPGMEYCDLKKERSTGRSKGYAYVKYASPDAAATAQARLNGAEFPPGSGCRMKVMFAEPALHRARSGSVDSGADTATPFHLGGATDLSVSSLGYLSTPPRDALAAAAAAAAPLGSPLSCESGAAAYGAREAGYSPHDAYGGVDGYGGGPPRRTTPPPLRSSALISSSSPDLLSAAADGLAGLCLDAPLERRGFGAPPRAALSPGTTLSGSLASSWHDLSPEGGASSGSCHGGASSAAAAAAATAPLDEATVVYSALPRPLPDYALAHVFSRCGPVEYVRVLPDERLAMVKYRDAESASRALGLLHGTQVLGEVLAVCARPPAQHLAA